ncbi:UDP-2,4-diacetamido-2,4,6-trideoxy-beta-L-altropyranose hydrolase [Aeromonas encheleia]|uniref:UDP-2,4-diacetamido-2,4, 6-trideoxy-beta-L-altropyranose hydrolase n=1 Tax=Aeromonas encheleia TaxID=73010 RepID=UPI000A03A6C2|nr:UDP-2,4-diacetamido-2,4,6-trideoxy-beta-L-altropyranose hydrolase [Aeromonas encheleia]
MKLAGKCIAFRADASLEAGSGHVMRCLTLADALREQGAKCWFICRAHPGHLADLISARDHRCHLLTAKPDSEQEPAGISLLAHASWLGCGWEQDAEQTQTILAELQPDWLVVDHYALDSCWEKILRPHVGCIMVIDDLADRTHDCDLLLDQNLGRQPDDYRERVPLHCTLLVGPRYSLLRPEFAALREYSRERRQIPTLKQVLITMGGVDKPNATGRVLEALRQAPLPDDCRICVVMGAKAPWLVQVEALAATLPWPTTVLANVSNIAQLMADSDLAIGAAGSTSWERCCLGLPTLMFVIADNQREVAHHLMSAGAAAVYMLTDNLEDNVINWLHSYVSEPEASINMLKNARKITDGLGVCRVIDIIASISMER